MAILVGAKLSKSVCFYVLTVDTCIRFRKRNKKFVPQHKMHPSTTNCWSVTVHTLVASQFSTN
jgi:hypothetical protein